MATAGKFDGKLLLLYVGNTKVAHSTSFSLSMGTSTIECTSKDSANWRDLLVGARSWSMSGDAYFTMDGTAGLDAFWNLYEGGTSATVKFTTDVSGDDFFSGTGILTTYDISGGLGEAATYSFTFEGDGALTRSTT